MSVYTGEYYEHTTDDFSGNIFYSFMPKSLVEGDFYEADEDLFSLLIAAHQALGILEGMIANLSDRDMLLELATLRECYYSRQIDYAGSSFHSLLESRGCGNGIGTVQNIIHAYEKASDRSLGKEFLCEAYTVIKKGIGYDKRLELRSVPMVLTNTITNLRQYNPTAPARISSGLEDMFLYLNQSLSDVLIKAALTHYQFEMIHPFESHNGIVGRLLVSKVMMNGGLPATPFLGLSELLYESKNDYFDLFLSTQKGGGYMRWIKFFVCMVHDAARRRIRQIEYYLQVVKRDEEKIRQYQSKHVHNVLAIFDYWKHYLISNTKHPAEELELAYGTVNRAVTIMRELGIVEQMDETSRYRKYVYSALIEAFTGRLSESGEL